MSPDLARFDLPAVFFAIRVEHAARPCKQATGRNDTVECGVLYPYLFRLEPGATKARPIIALLMLTLLSAAAHAQSAWVKLCETQTATVTVGTRRAEGKKICLTHQERLDHTGKVLVSAAFRRRGSGKTSVHGDCPTWRAAGAGLVTGPLTLVPQLLFPRRRHLRSRRCTGSLPKYP